MNFFHWNFRAGFARTLAFSACMLLTVDLTAQQPMQQSWEHIPELGVNWITYPDESVPNEYIDKHLRLLVNPDQQEQLEAAQWFSNVSSSLTAEAKQAITPHALGLLEDKTAPRQLRQVLASTLVALNTGSTSNAEQLWRLTADDSSIRPFVESALVSWKLDFARQLWMNRLTMPNAPENELSLALRGLAAIGERDAVEPIARLIEQEIVSQPLILQACDALGQLTSESYEGLAIKCLESDYSAGELMAARIVRNHAGPQAAAIAARLIKSQLQPARRVAFQWYASHSPQELAGMLGWLKADEDGGVRWLAIDQLCGPENVESVKLLGECLADPLPMNRQRVRDGLIQKGKVSSLTSVVFEVLRASLQKDFGAGSEEATEVAVALKARQFNAQLIDLLDHPLPVIRVRAAWALQELGVEDPDQLAAVLLRCLKLTEAHENKSLQNSRPIEVQWAYLLSVLGNAKYQEAEEMLRKYVAKHVFPTIPRVSGIWSLGNVLAGSRDEALAGAIEARMLDVGPMGEDISVRYASAVAIGYITSPSSKKNLAACSEKSPSPVGLAVDWALSQINGSTAEK